MKKLRLLCISTSAAMSVAISLFSAPIFAATLTDGSVFTGPLSTVDGFEDLSQLDLAQYREGYSISDELQA